MRISEDSTSWRASGIIRRDTRARRDTPEVPRTRRPKTNRRRWCRGHVGVEHRLEFVTNERVRTLTRTSTGYAVNEVIRPRYRCARCGMDEHPAMPAEVHAQVHPLWADHLAARARWCGDGHLYEKVPVQHLWLSAARVCVMCGWCPERGRPLAVDPPTELRGHRDASAADDVADGASGGPPV